MAWRKERIQQWLNDRNVFFSDRSIKAELVNMGRQYPIDVAYLTDVIALDSGKDIIVVRLLIGHCELNPIELIWAQMKQTVAKNNKSFRLSDVEQLAIQTIGSISAESWAKAEQHVIKIENEYALRMH